MACLIFKYLNSTNNFTVASYIFLNEFRLIQYLNPFFLLRFMLDFLYLCGFNKILKKRIYTWLTENQKRKEFQISLSSSVPSRTLKIILQNQN